MRVSTDDIVCIHANGNYSDLYLFNGTSYLLTFQLHFFDEICRKLQNNVFLRVGKSLIVNRNYIFKIDLQSQDLILNGQNMLKEVRTKASKEALKELKNLMDQEGGKK
ncbi:MAG: LytTR family transcriptional regulator DNA-binding domain-containing protein [Bacteroidales bacterium]|nr:LytTR family transcriptional regulator DNA-binding domain-containing protein [Bacteroidales bacterium]